MSIADSLETVRSQIRNATAAAGRAENEVQLLAVSKRKPASAVLEAMQAGQLHFGENYVQEALAKQQTLIDLLEQEAAETRRPIWHFIGPLQSNKTSDVASHFDWFHTLDRLKIARRLSDQRPDHLPPLQCCLQINISGDDNKSGLVPDDHEAITDLASAIADLPRLKLRGLMCIPAADLDDDSLSDSFRRMKALLAVLVGRLVANGHEQAATDMDTLSMGMSADMQAAIAAGATIVRVGTAIFGERD